MYTVVRILHLNAEDSIMAQLVTVGYGGQSVSGDQSSSVLAVNDTHNLSVHVNTRQRSSSNGKSPHGGGERDVGLSVKFFWAKNIFIDLKIVIFSFLQ